MEQVPGIDVSRWQGEIDWLRVAAAGYRFAMIRATIGDDYVDPRFHTNWVEARRAGLLISTYHVVAPRVSAQDQVHHFFDVLDGRKADFPLVIDVERSDGADRDEITACVKRCLEDVEVLDGRRPIVYTARWYWNRYVLPSEAWSNYDLWIASYTSEPLLPRDWDEWLFWQYSESGKVPGVMSKGTDLNWFDGDYQDLLAYAGQEGEPDTPTDPFWRAEVVIPKLNVRSGPGTSYEDVGDLYEGAEVGVLALTGNDVWVEFEPGRWAAFSYKGETYMKLVPPPEDEPPTPPADDKS